MALAALVFGVPESATPTHADPTSLAITNAYRALANLPAVTENATHSDGDFKHACYTVENGVATHQETVGNAWYTAERARRADKLAGQRHAEPDRATGPDHVLRQPGPGRPVLLRGIHGRGRLRTLSAF
jgi:hypothetical protein